MNKNICDESGRFQLSAEPADTFTKRFRGLMFKPSLPSGQGLLLVPCSSIHTCFMRFTIDVVYLSKDYKVLGIETIAPWRVGRHVPGTKMVLETAAGYAAQLQTGSSLICRQAPAEYSGLHGPER